MQLLNTMTKKKEVFKSRKEGEVKIFTCGPSIYRRPHIGNYRTFLYEDILLRYLESRGNRVKRIMNLTDIEDKSIEEAMYLQKKMEYITSDAAAYFQKETKELRIKLPEILPSSSSTIQEAAEITKILIDKGHAYHHRDGVFFDPLTVKNFGKLYGLDMSTWPKKKIRFKRDTYNGNRWNRGDFILWHADKGEHVHFWDSVVGRGRPSWNIQDPAIIHAHLGNQIDINCGGIDNIYRHHDYNIAIMEALTGKEYAQIYLHGEHLVVDGKTMSKSRGNILFPENIYSRGFTPCELRFFLTSEVHYRKKLNFTLDHMNKSVKRLRVLKELIRKMTTEINFTGNSSGNRNDVLKMIHDLPQVFFNEMDNDLYLAGGVDAVEKQLIRIKNQHPAPLPEKAAKKLISAIEKIDKTLCCLI